MSSWTYVRRDDELACSLPRGFLLWARDGGSSLRVYEAKFSAVCVDGMSRSGRYGSQMRIDGSQINIALFGLRDGGRRGGRVRSLFVHFRERPDATE